MLIIIAVLAIVVVWFNRRKLASLKRHKKKILIYGVIAILALLTITGKLNLLLGALGVAVGFLWLIIQKSLFIFQSVPFAGPLLFRFIFRSAKNKSSFTSSWVKIFIHRPSGVVDGEVLQGDYRGRRLSSLKRSDLDRLLESLRQHDRKGFLLLQSYLIMRFRQSAQGQPAGEQPAGEQPTMNKGMDREEALRILGLSEGADEEAVKAAHKQLMQKLHPDRGGSTYLSAKVNEARDFLLKR